MRRANTVVRASDLDPWKIRSRVELDHDHRYRRRLVLKAANGESFLLDLAEATHLKHGDGLLLDDGAIILIQALPEPLLEIGAPTMTMLMQIAWHLGNRHVPTQLCGDRLRIRTDHVLAEMVYQLHGTVTTICAAFDPEGGAYGKVPSAYHHHAGHEHHHADHDHPHE
ncbi:MAG TPA: urease accessory protein UreE [Stellaceae bacterium]|jgi:urease accessory protein|nr:urease accessory protein UreE [Stellaceae bacterium]